MSTLQFTPPRVPLVDVRTGQITREWLLFFQGVYARVGGPLGSSTTDLDASAFDDAGTEELEAAVYALADELQQGPPRTDAPPPDPLQPPAAAPPPADEPANDLAALREEVQALRARLDALEQGPNP